MAKYGLFHRITLASGRNRWVRLYPKSAYPRASAIRVFQSALIHLSMRGKHPGLRPVKD
jgi:hypothetical protein